MNGSGMTYVVEVKGSKSRLEGKSEAREQTKGRKTAEVAAFLVRQRWTPPGIFKKAGLG